MRKLYTLSPFGIRNFRFEIFCPPAQRRRRGLCVPTSLSGRETTYPRPQGNKPRLVGRGFSRDINRPRAARHRLRSLTRAAILHTSRPFSALRLPSGSIIKRSSDASDPRAFDLCGRATSLYRRRTSGIRRDSPGKCESGRKHRRPAASCSNYSWQPRRNCGSDRWRRRDKRSGRSREYSLTRCGGARTPRSCQTST